MLREQARNEMERVFSVAPYGVEHTLRVLANVEAILDGEAITGAAREQAVIAAILHDIGALEALRVHGSMDGPYQEQEGQRIAREILERLGANPVLRERVCYLVGHHHTPGSIDGPDFQALWEADLLDNTEYGDQQPDPDALEPWIEANFQSAAGRRLARKRLIQPFAGGNP